MLQKSKSLEKMNFLFRFVLGTKEATDQTYAADECSVAYVIIDGSEWFIWVVNGVDIQAESNRSDDVHAVAIGR